MESIMDRMAERVHAVDGEPTSLVDLGYSNCGLDDNWQQCHAGAFDSFHDANGNPLINTDRFPDMKSMTDYGHSLDLHVGWYMNNCICQEKSWTGSGNITKHMERSAQAVADLGFDGLKLDGCGQFRNLTWWSELLNATGRPILIENCHWGGTVPGDTVGDGPCDGTTETSDCPYNFFRTSGDITNTWDSMHKNLLSTRKFQGEVPLSRPGAWAYPDMMEVGRMATLLEDRSHFGAWVITSSPLILGYDLNDENITSKVWDIIANKEAIAINQAWAGHPGRQVKTWPAVQAAEAATAAWSSHVDEALSCSGAEYAGAVGSYGSAEGCRQAVLSKADQVLTNYALWRGDGDGGCYVCSVTARGPTDTWPLSSLPGAVSFVRDGYLPALMIELWSKPLADGKVAALVLNNAGHVLTSFDLADLGITGNASVRDVWARRDLPTASGSVALELEEHDSSLLVFTPTQSTIV